MDLTNLSASVVQGIDDSEGLSRLRVNYFSIDADEADKTALALMWT